MESEPDVEPMVAKPVQLSENELRIALEVELALMAECPRLARKFRRFRCVMRMRRILIRLLCLTAATAWQRDATGALP